MSSSSEDELERLRAELAAERAKNKEMEEKQTQLRTELAGERGKRESLSNELQQCRKWNVELQTLSEQEEENISNKLIKRLTSLKREKEELAMQVEVEEEFLTNSLQAKLDQLRQEKIDLEIELENEQEKIFNRLHKQLSSVTSAKEALEKRFSEDSTGLLNALDASINKLKDDSTFQSDEKQAQLLERIVKEITTLKISHAKSEENRGDQKVNTERAQAELAELKRENDSLRAKVAAEHALLDKVAGEKARLECEREEELERLYNLGAMNPCPDNLFFTYVRERSNSVSSQESGHSGRDSARSLARSGPTHSENSTRSSTRSSTPFGEGRSRASTGGSKRDVTPPP